MTPALVFLLSAMHPARAQDTAPAPPAPPQTEHETVRIHRGWPPFRFEIKATGEDDAEGNITIKITGGPKRYRGQKCKAEIDEPNRPGFDTDDINFDGYQDFFLTACRGATGNMCYEYWIFNPNSVKFESAPAFERITSIDTAHKLLISSSKLSELEHLTEYYRLANGKPMIIKSVQWMWTKDAKNIVPSNYKPNAVKITRIYEHGKLRRTFYTEIDD